MPFSRTDPPDPAEPVINSIRKERMNNSLYMFTATCAMGLETLLAGELTALGGEEISNSAGAVTFRGGLETGYRACLWSRFAGRILLPLAEFRAKDSDELYHGCLGIDWKGHLDVRKTFAVDCTSDRSPIHHTRYASLRVKDAVVDQFREKFNLRPSISTERPDIRIHLYLKGEDAIVSLDLSGESLHRRGYRVAGGEAPLKESLAAAIVSLSGWNRDVSAETILLDPMCGSGTLLIEAALIYGDIAPGLRREYFGFSGWTGHDRRLWKRLSNEAIERKRTGLNRHWPMIIGYDADKNAVETARENINGAGLTSLVRIEQRGLAGLRGPRAKPGASGERPGLLVVNPPYGARQGSPEQARYLYRCLGRKLTAEFKGWRMGLFTGNPEITDELGIRPAARYRLYNGPIKSQLRVLEIPDLVESPETPRWQPTQSPIPHESQEFANRVRKNLKNLSRWAEREEISCYRIYDSDLPDYNLAIDLYGQFVHVQEYAPPGTVAPEKAAARLDQAVKTLGDLMGVGRNRIFVKVRHRQTEGRRYQKMAEKGRLHEVTEHGLRLLVNLSDYLDTGLFLDHRIIRVMIRNMAEGGRFLNLFGYTGSATVSAAAGEARTTTTVDLSPVYLEWARCNLALNGFSESDHEMVQADCLDWLHRSRDRYDLILVSPPTFSNSKRIKKVFDIQQDHVHLIRSAMARLRSGGSILFSTHFRRFKLDLDGLSGLDVEDISYSTIPPEIQRNNRIHQSWLIRHQGDSGG